MIENPEILAELSAEALEHIENVEAIIMKWETDPKSVDTDDVNSAFRAIHSIKGGFSFFNLVKIKSLSHAMETILGEIRNNQRNITGDLNDALLKGLDVLRVMVATPRDSEKISIDDLIKKITNATMDQNQIPVDLSPIVERDNSGQLAPVNRILQTLSTRNMSTYKLILYSRPDLLDRMRSTLDFHRELSVLGEVLDVKIDLESISGLDDERVLTTGLAYLVFFASELDAKIISEVIRIPSEQIVLLFQARRALLTNTSTDSPIDLISAETAEKVVEVVVNEPPQTSLLNPVLPSIKSSTTNDTLRVKVDHLDRLVTLGSELVLSRNQLQMRFEEIVNNGPIRSLLARCIGDDLKSIEGQNGDCHAFQNIISTELTAYQLCDQILESLAFRLNDIPCLRSALKNIDNVTSEMQTVIMQIRLLPESRLFEKFTRVVHDLGNQLGKSIKLIVDSADADLDKTVLDAITDPLTHILRNAADHGIETPAERKQLGKPEQGSIILSAIQTGGLVRIIIRDDGRGINYKRIAQVIVEKGLLKHDQVAKLSEQEIIKFIMRPGFSTANQVTDVSGRGVGLDVVRTNIEKLGGSFTIDTAVGEGTTFTLILPLTLAIIPALIVRSGEYNYAIPQSMIREIVQLDGLERKIKSIQNASVLKLRDQMVPVIDLNEQLGIANNKEKRAVLIIQTETRPFGLSVEEIADGVEIVVRPIHPHLKSIHAYSGATILGDGSLCLILDPPSIAKQAGISYEKIDQQNAETGALAEQSQEQILLIRNTDGKFMGLFMRDIVRLEKVSSKKIELVGNKWFLQHRGEILPLLKTIELLPERRTGERRVEFKTVEDMDVVLVNGQHGLVGLVVNEIYDARMATINKSHSSRDGVAFCALIDEMITEFLDIHRLTVLADINAGQMQTRHTDISNTNTGEAAQKIITNEGI